MKKLLFIISVFSLLSFTTWQPSFETAMKIAGEKHQLVLLNFSGSDWCGPCIRIRKEIFENEVFLKMADTTVILYNADFPRNKKNQLEPSIKKQNELLADKYNQEGKFPLTLLLDSKGNILKSWDGFPKESVEMFVSEIRKTCDGYK